MNLCAHLHVVHLNVKEIVLRTRVLEQPRVAHRGVENYYVQTPKLFYRL